MFPSRSLQPRTTARLALAWLVALLLTASAATATAGEGLRSLRSAGVGDNVVAAAAGNAALFHNPAGLGSVSMYSLELGWDTQLKSGSHQASVSIADSQTNAAIAGGLAYTFSFNKGGEKGDHVGHNEHHLRLSAAVPVIPETLIFGITGQYLHFNQGREGGSREGAKIKHSGFSLDLGVMAKLGQKVFIGVSAQDLLRVEGATGPRTIRAGLSGMFGAFRILGEYGAHLDGPRTRHHGGAGIEVMIHSVALRTGFRHVSAGGIHRHENLMSFGAGYRGQRFGLDFAYRQHIQRAPDRFIGVSAILFM